MTRRRLLPAIVVVVLAVAGAAAQQQRPRIPPTGTIKNVRDNLYVIPGAGGNTTVFVTHARVVLVDTKLPNNGEAIRNQVRRVTDKPVTIHGVRRHAVVARGDQRGRHISRSWGSADADGSRLALPEPL